MVAQDTAGSTSSISNATDEVSDAARHWASRSMQGRVGLTSLTTSQPKSPSKAPRSSQQRPLPPLSLTSPHPALPSSLARDAESQSASPRSLRSPSPSRRQAFAERKLDPLLANLSPMATLEALKASDAVDINANSQHRLLAESIAHVSEEERALGIRAAVAGKMLREWLAELEKWESDWSKSRKFAIPDTWDDSDGVLGGEAGRNTSTGEGKMRGAASEEEAYNIDREYWGSLPASTVTTYDYRLNEMQDEMDALELESLKSYVRTAHLLRDSPGSPRHAKPAAANSNHPRQAHHRPTSSYTKIDDFTVVITATIMQALPYLSKVSSLIERWQTRLLVLRRVPRFLHLLASAQSAMHDAEDAIGGFEEANFTRHDFYATRDVLRARNNALAETLDSMLDILEGRPDSLPDAWIEEMENLEVLYQDWVADAEECIMNNILRGPGRRPSDDRALREEDNILEPIQEADSGEEEGDGAVHSPQALGADREISSTRVLRDEDQFPLAKRDGAGMPDSPDYATNDLGRFSMSPEPDEDIAISPTAAHVPEKRSSAGGQDTLSSRPQTGSAYNQSSRPATARQIDMVTRGQGLYKESSRGQASMFPEDPEHPTAFAMHEQEAGDADVEDGTETADESAYDDSSYADVQKAPRKSSSDETRARSFHTRNSSDLPPWGRSRASTAGTLASWSEHSDSGEDVEGGFKSYKRAGQLPSVQETRSRPTGRALQAQVDPSFSYDDIFSSLVQPLSNPSSPVMRAEGVRPRSSHLKEKSRLPSRLDLAKLPSLPSLPSLETGDSSKDPVAEAVQNRPAPRRHNSEHRPVQRSARTIKTQPQRRHSEDQLTQRISTVLSRIPAPIQLFSGPEPDAVEITQVEPAARSRNASVAPVYEDEPPGTPVTDPRMALYSNPPLALPLKLAPAASSAKSTSGPSYGSHSAQSEVKLYHLHQPGQSQPIKLYVRLVGEAHERVMVRVGGGWSDLEAYLKSYAVHHGRSASVGGPMGGGAGIEVRDFNAAGTQSPWSTGSPASRTQGHGGTASCPTTPAAMQSSPAAPTSASSTASPANLPVHSKDYVSRARRHVSAGPYLQKLAAANVVSSPVTTSAKPPQSQTNSRPSSRGAKDKPPVAATPPTSPRPRRSSSSSWLSGFRPFTPPTQVQRVVHDPLGPAGPVANGKAKDISPRKKAWVEGVMKQARRVSSGVGIDGSSSSARRRPDNAPRFGSVGSVQQDSAEVGAVRRVFLRRPSQKGRS